MGFLCLFPLFLTFLLIFHVHFLHFLWISENFHGGSDPPNPSPFSDGGSEFFFMGGQEVEMGGQIVF